VSLIKAGMKCIIDLSGTGSFTASAQTNSGEIAINVASTTGILPGDIAVLTLTPTTGSPYSYTTKVGRVDSGTVFSVMYGLPDKIVIGGAISLTAGSHYTEIVSVNTGANTFEITNAIPASRSVAIGANIDFWKWEKSGYGSTVGETVTFTTSPKFTGGLNMLTGDSPLNLENGDAGDLNAPAMTVKANRYVEFLDEDGSSTNSSFLIQNSNDYLAFGHAGQSKIRLEPEGLAIGSGAYSDTPNIISGSGDPATARAQTFTASSSSGLLATYATNLPNYVRVRFTTTGTLPTGLSTGTDYWVVKASDTTCRFATSYANARAGTVVAYTNAGTGTHTVNRAEKKGTMYIRIDGSSTSTRIYVNTDGALAWTHLTTGA
jgi:plastocyanin